ncbi:FAD-binding oxidoreductase [Streptosporangium lutulentum]
MPRPPPARPTGTRWDEGWTASSSVLATPPTTAPCRLFNPAFDGVRPAGVAYCANPSDVAECVNFARRMNVPLAVRSGGHSYAGWSTGTGLVVDVSRMAAVSHASGRATVGAGAKLIDVYDKLASKGVSIPAGTCATVGVSGLALGGGIGVVSRKYGLTCDVLESVQLVTADGRC